MFFFLLLLIVGLNFAVNDGNRPEPIVAVTGAAAGMTPLLVTLDSRGVEATSARITGEENATINVNDNHAAVVLTGQDPPRWIPLVEAIEASGIPYANIAVQDESGFAQVDLLRANLPAVAAIGFMAIAFMGTAVPLVSLRQRGTLRLLGTTPVKKLTFIAAQTPVRFASGMVVALLVSVISIAMGYVSVVGLARLTATFLLGLLMFFAFAYLLASRSRNAELINHISAVIPVLALFASGEVFPKQILPEPVLVALNVLPTTWFAQAAGTDLSGTTPFIDVYLLWAMMLAVTIGVALLAARIFVWDDRDR
ncbi:ABC transporter permease [Cryobacterium aureum]|uniref:ABC transporter permease n=1 Tax=Cryobacterium aureum TaxID=995037 RepID=UPI00137529A8|nr:ABC transporter permease [Cryobacterium aureum]